MIALGVAGGCGAAVDGVRHFALEQIRTDLILSVPSERTGTYRYWRQAPDDRRAGAVDFVRGWYLEHRAGRTSPDGTGPRDLWVLNRGGDGFGRVTVTGRRAADLSGGWARLDPAKLKYSWPSARSAAGDPAGSIVLVDEAVTARLDAAGRYSGTVDLLAVVDAGLPPVAPGHLAALGPAARRAPFKAVLDGRGRLTEMSVSVPPVAGFPDASITCGYGYDDVRFPEVRAEEPATADLYRMLEGG
ncbi:hypothetical protein GCM10010124_31780 [Pilimelia terevasa]|uniref:Uncharacterized protein n=1 Tax=Pilimelia terevasa TaxID=53372 RepID=A0A8J3BVH0_9ACTN|nr:hypothetical protein [Pilimelia terevasa]GGK36768.1 hypothetical protein GCM10010124_31780 [Pilimelia terevasa]